MPARRSSDCRWVFRNPTGDKKKTPTFVLESADCHVNSSLLHAGIMIQGPEFLVGTKRHYLSMQESQHDIPWPLWQWQTYANEGECHSHYDPVTESLTPPTGPPSVSGKKKKEGSWKTGRYEQLPARRTGVTWLLCYLGFFAVLSALSWFPCFCNLFHWPICLAESFLFCVCLCCAVEGGTGLHGRDSLKWKCRLLPAVAKAHLIRG